jgi:LPS-assembly protein
LISGLLMVPSAQAASTWDCRVGSDGSWECLKDGVLAPPVVKKARPAAPAIKPASEPEPMQAEPITADQAPAAAKEPVTEIRTEPVQHQVARPAKPAPRPIPVEPAKPRVAEQPEEAKEEPKARVAEEARKPQPAKAEEKPETAGPMQERGEAIAASRIDQGLDWSQCDPDAPLVSRTEAPRSDDLTQIESDSADLHRKEDLAIFKGNVRVKNNQDYLEADEVHYNRKDDSLDASGNVLVEQDGLRFTSDETHYLIGQSQGTARKVEYRLLDRAARGSAETVQIVDQDVSHYTNVNYTTCAPGNDGWVIEANEMSIDRASGMGTASNARVRFKGVPFIYLPKVSFPIDDRRKSGLLVPSVGYSSDNGLDIELPYYLNIAPNMDATLIPRIMSERGLMLGGEFRYLQERHKGEIRADYLPSDNTVAAGESDSRGSFAMQAGGDPAPRWRYDINLNYISDDDYLDDLGGSLAVSSARHLERRGDVRYYGDGWDFLGRVQQYQTIDENIAATDEPYSRLPQLLFNLDRPHQATGLNYHLRAEYVQFDHTLDSKETAQRIDLQPGVSYPMRETWGFLTPRLSLRHTSYSFDNHTTNSHSRTLPTFSLDGGLYIDRDTSWFGQPTQTLEPRLFYLYTPEENQDVIPAFDTDDLEFSFANLFRENRFSGADRVGDANQLTTAVTTRVLSDRSGDELFRASLGQIFYFADREVQMPSVSDADDSSSAIVAEVASRINQNWRVSAGIQWNPHADDNETERSAFSVNYHDDRDRIFNLAYRYTDGIIEQADLSTRWPISHNLHAVARWDYSLLHNQTMEAFGGIEYGDCCWVTRIVARQYRNDADDEMDTAILLQLELKGLTSLGEKLDQFLERGILGYRSED